MKGELATDHAMEHCQSIFCSFDFCVKELQLVSLLSVPISMETFRFSGVPVPPFWLVFISVTKLKFLSIFGGKKMT
jgi:hypothetical protein